MCRGVTWVSESVTRLIQQEPGSIFWKIKAREPRIWEYQWLRRQTAMIRQFKCLMAERPRANGNYAKEKAHHICAICHVYSLSVAEPNHLTLLCAKSH